MPLTDEAFGVLIRTHLTREEAEIFLLRTMVSHAEREAVLEEVIALVEKRQRLSR